MFCLIWIEEMQLENKAVGGSQADVLVQWWLDFGDTTIKNQPQKKKNDREQEDVFLWKRVWVLIWVLSVCVCGGVRLC